MSAEPKAVDSLAQLKELMLGDEQKAIALLKERLDALDAGSVERLAEELAEALRRRQQRGDASFDEFVAALQAGTESAIQRSVSEDKSRLSKALFPIMGPAIRNYVIDLFRGMVEDLNETIRDTTSAERLKWRVQAKLAGKSYSEYVLLKTRSFRIDEVYLMQRDTGLLLLHVARDPGDEADGEADLVSGMFTAIRSFVHDSFADESAGDDDASELDSFTFGEREVLIEAGPAMVLAAVVHGVPPGSTREALKGILEELHAELGGRLDHFSGDMTELESGRPLLRKALLESREKGEGNGRAAGGGGLWRAWVFLAVVATGIAFYLVIGFREQARWNRFEESLRSEPGVAITAVDDDGWWRRRLVRGLRDPLAVDPSARLEEFGINSGKVRFEWDLMESLDPAFAARREALTEDGQRRILEAIASLRSELEKARTGAATTESLEALSAKLDEQEKRIGERIETDRAEDERTLTQAMRRWIEASLRSRFADVDGLVLSFSESGDAVMFSGTVSAVERERVLAQVEPLSGWMQVDTDGLVENSSGRIAALRRAIESVAIPYRSGTLEEEDELKAREVADLAKQLDELAAELGTDFRYEVLAHPLIGENREANRVIERTRADQVREALVAAGIDAARIVAALSDDLGRSGEGVGVRAVATSESRSSGEGEANR